MHPILTITLNPALDLASHAAKVEPGPKIRCSSPKADPGGGGINVSRAIRILGGKSIALAALGGANGNNVARLLAAEGIECQRFEIAGETRQSFSVTDDTTGEQYRFVTPGPTWAKVDQTRLLSEVGKNLSGQDIVVLSGSTPAGVATDFPFHLQSLVSSKGAQLAADLSGEALKQAVSSPKGLWMLRMDQSEAEAVADKPLPSHDSVSEFGATLVDRDVARIIVIGLGAQGSVMITPQTRHHARCDVPTVRSRVGAGDSLMGAMILAFARGDTPAQALTFGVAAASAAVLTEATELCRRADVERLLSNCVLTSL